jgi:hypothetical protein
MTSNRTSAKPGNDLAVKHGGHAQIVAGELADVAAQITAALPVKHQADEWAVAELADALIRLHRFRAWLAEHDPWKQRGKMQLAKVKSAMRWEERYAGRVLRLLKELGMTPAARAKLGVDIARSVSLAEAMSEPNPTKRAALLEQAGLEAGDD